MPTDPQQNTGSEHTDGHDAMIRALLRGSAERTSLPTIDPGAVIRRSRGRRTPKLVAAGGVFSLAAIGIGVAGVSGIQNLGGQAVDSAGTAPESATDGLMEQSDLPLPTAPAEQVNLCGGMLAPPSLDPTIDLSVQFPAEASVGSDTIAGTVTLTNTGTEPLVASSPAALPITLSKDGSVLWHTTGPMILSLATLDLRPGDSFSWQAAFEPARCADEQTLESTPPDELPAVDPGVYQLSAVVDLTLDDGTVRQISGTPSNIVLR